ncbi:MAG: spermidine/putrescine ABC transporter substrate-binding protein, partial [Alphaproteobacteria bacterium]|nr:spermidine/putrescine ABC transporter substrate-binding protein [Alphaproteobacteria bacterium]
AGIALKLEGYKAFAAEEKKLNLYNWDTYIGKTTLADFKSATGIKVKMDLFADNDELFSKLREGNPGYDVIVPTSDYVQRMIKANMLMPLDHDKLPNMKNLFKIYLDSEFDPGRKFSMPYQTGSMGIGYRTSAVKGTNMATLKWLYDSDKFKGRLALQSESTTVLRHAGKYLGFPYNMADKKQIAKAADLIISQKKNIRAFAPDTGQDMLLAKDVDVAQEWSGDIWQVNKQDADINYAFPKEGGLWFQDCIAIPKGAPHPDNAHAFINFIMDAAVAKAITETIGYSTPNEAAYKMMPDSYKKNPILWPDSATRKKFEPTLYLGEENARALDEAWTRVQAG